MNTQYSEKGVLKMKKVLSLLFCVCFMLALCVPAYAAGTATLNGNASTTNGSTVEYILNVSGCGDATSVAVAVSFDDAFELVSATWLKNGSLNRFDTATNKGVLGGLNSPNINGDVFKLVLKAKTASANAHTVSVNFIARNGSNDIMNVTPTKTVKIACSSHNYSAYTKLNDSQHQRTCSACGYVETSGHTWNGGTVVKAATCKETGTKEYACTACGAKKTETVAKTNAHIWGDWHITKQPSCTTPGTTTKTCSVCGKTENQTVNATGHSMGGWTQTKAPTCTEKGEEMRSCSKCGHSETKAIAALGHSFSNPTVTKEPTCTETGVETGKCSRCGQTTTNTLKAKGHKFGAWADSKAATCTEGGTQERKCSACGATESRATKALGHDFENPTIVKEATISSTGLREGKCKRCGETTSEVIPCTAKDDATGAIFEADAGVFTEGTTLSVEEIGRDNPSYALAENVLKDTCKDFKLYDVSASRNGADVQPNGELTVTWPIPDGFGTDVALYLLSSDGTAEPIEATVSADGKTLTAKLTKLGELALGKLGNSSAGSNDPTDSTDSSVSDDVPAQGSSLVWIIVAIAAVVVIGGAIVLIVILKKKKA